MIVYLTNCVKSWSPTHELVPDPPLRHGHAISIDMAFSATLSFLRGRLSKPDHLQLLGLFSRAGLAMDHVDFDEQLLLKATVAILKTRNGKLRATVPVSPMGESTFLNDVTHEEMCDALKFHKDLMKEFPRDGVGIDAYVDVSDTGYTLGGEPIEAIIQKLGSQDAMESPGVTQESTVQTADLSVQA